MKFKINDKVIHKSEPFGVGEIVDAWHTQWGDRYRVQWPQSTWSGYTDEDIDFAPRQNREE